MKKMRKWLTVLGLGICLYTTSAPALVAYAETEPTYEATELTSMMEAYVGVVNTESLNVRTGCGTNYDQIEVNGEKLKIYEGDKVAIMSVGLSTGGKTWYEVRWVEDGVKYHGYVSGTFLKKTEERAYPIATPTPVPTPTPEPTPTPIATPTPEPTPTPMVMPTTAPEQDQKGEGGFDVLTVIAIVAVLLLAAGGVTIFLMIKKRGASAAETTEKIDSLKNIQLKKNTEETDGNSINVMRRKTDIPEETRENIPRPQNRGYESDAAMLARKEHARMVNAEIMEKSRFYDPNEEKKKEDELKQLSESLKEKELLREEIENLSPGDLVYHEYFGKGVVFDNSDVKRIEIRFGTDVRFVDKAACVAKKLMRKV